MAVVVSDAVANGSQAQNTTYRSEFAEGSATDKAVADEISDKLVAALERITLSLYLTLMIVSYTMVFIICGEH